jgi:hypothetical protein
MPPPLPPPCVLEGDVTKILFHSPFSTHDPTQIPAPLSFLLPFHQSHWHANFPELNREAMARAHQREEDKRSRLNSFRPATSPHSGCYEWLIPNETRTSL